MNAMRLLLGVVIVAFMAAASPAFAQPNSTLWLPSIASLKALPVPTVYPGVIVKSYYSGGNAGGGFFEWVAGTCTPDDGAWIAVTSVSSTVGCYRRLINLPNVTPEMWGAQPNTSTAANTALNAALAYIAAQGVGCVVLSDKYYSIASNVFAVSQDGGCLEGQGQYLSQLRPITPADGDVALRVTGTNVRLGNFRVSDPTGAGITCFFIGPTSAAATNSKQDNGAYENLGCEQAKEGIVLRAGGTNSSVYYNKIDGFWCISCRRTVLFPTGSAVTGANRNTLSNINQVNLGGTQNNTFIQIDNGDGNSFIGGSCNGVQEGTTPNNPPTIIKTGAQGTNNKFFGIACENTITTPYNIVNAGSGNEFHGMTFTEGLWDFTAQPSIFTCGPDTSICPLIVGPLIYQGNSQVSGVPCNNCAYLWPGQLAFPAVQVPSTGANTLDDYEEGTFTPVLSFGGGTTGITYSAQAGAYTKNGNVVTFTIGLALTNKGSSTGGAVIDGLPFTTKTGAVYTVSASTTAYNIGAAVAPVSSLVNQNATTIALYNVVTGTLTALDDADFTDTSTLAITGSYFAAQ